MDAIIYIREMLGEKTLKNFIIENFPAEKENWLTIQSKTSNLRRFMESRKFRELPGDEKQALIKSVQLTAPKLTKLIGEIVGHIDASRKQSSSSVSHDLAKDYCKKIVDLINGMLEACNYSKHIKRPEFKDALVKVQGYTYWDAEELFDHMERIGNIENMLLETADRSNSMTLNQKQSQALLLKTAIYKNFDYYNVYEELLNLPHLISKAYEGQSLALILIGGLLSVKPATYDTWNKVKDDLVKIKESNNQMWHIFTYCYNDLPYPLQRCFLYFACYPIGYEIPATSLTEIWIAEGFVSTEETANKYLEQLVERSLVCVSKRSILGTIKSCRVPPSILGFAIQQSHGDGFLVANPDQEEIESLFRLAIHQDSKKQYTEVKSNQLCSFLAFNFDRNVLGSAVLLRVLALRNSAIPVTALPNMIRLRYLGLRGNNICELPENIGEMENLETLDVRDTSIKTLPESLWYIQTLCNVYVEPSPQNKGPPSAANTSNLHILKTVVAHESWKENIPKFLTNLRKLALSNCDNLDWKSISNLLSHMDNLISMAIVSKIVPSECVDTRAFSNLETVKSIKLEGKWICRKLFIDNVKFPTNLTKLTLTNSGLTEDPMPTLERLQALKSLSLKDGAYVGKQMVCSAKGFPQLQFLELSKLENLEIWEVESVRGYEERQMTMPHLTTLRVVQCQKLNNLPNLDHVTNKVIDRNVVFTILL